jgi:cytochrome oxidase Cu insertion factor (SCO1/SenC/PrrC family)
MVERIERRARRRAPAPAGALAVTLVLAAAWAVAGAAAARQLPSPAASPTEIRPLLLGTEVPTVAVRGIDGEDADLRAVVAGKPTLLVFYRGGW